MPKSFRRQKERKREEKKFLVVHLERVARRMGRVAGVYGLATWQTENVNLEKIPARYWRWSS